MASRGTDAVNTLVSASQIVVGVGAVVWNSQDEVLLIRRANPPRQNEWSLPGGRVEFGEPLRDALLRELREELDVAELMPEGGGDRHYVLVDFTARVKSGDLEAGSDAADARWFTMGEVAGLPLWSETRRVLEVSATTLANK